MRSFNCIALLAVVLAVMVGVASASQWCSNFQYDFGLSNSQNENACSSCCRSDLGMKNGGYILQEECYCN